MAQKLYLGVNNKARLMKKAYVGVGGKARTIKKIYVGVEGRARLAYQSGVPLTGLTLTWGNLGSSVTLTPVFTPENATDRAVTWSLSGQTGDLDCAFRCVESDEGNCIVSVSGTPPTSSQNPTVVLTASASNGITVRAKITAASTKLIGTYYVYRISTVVLM